MSFPPGSLHAGLEALKQGDYQEAIRTLELCCDRALPGSKELTQAQINLVKAYWKGGQPQRAQALCQRLATSEDPQVQNWAAQRLEQMASVALPTSDVDSAPQPALVKAGRAAAAGAKLVMAGASNLALASLVTVSLLFGMVFVLCLSLLLIYDSQNPALGLAIAVALTLIVNTAIFFLSPFLMDLMQRWLYQTRWVSLADIERQSPESAQIIRRVCAERKLKQPKLGIIDDQNPTAFTYGSLPNTARLVVSQGLFTYLDDDEAATVYAHELGHIVHWDFAVMTVASTLVQIMYLIYSFANRMSRGGGNSKAKDVAATAAIAAYVFYIVGTYLVLYLSRTREYFADHFAAETTGNPNGLSRALVKIAYGIVEEGKRQAEPSRLLEGTRALGIYDAKAASSTGTAYRISAHPEKVGRVFLWDMFNPWAWWMQLNSTHPLTGKRVRALSTYAEQLGLETEFNMAQVVAEGKQLNKSRLYGGFLGDLILYGAELIGVIVGLGVGIALFYGSENGLFILAGILVGLGVGIIVKTFIAYPQFNRAPESDILTLMADPYASPLRGKPVRLNGALIGRGDAGNRVGSDLKLQDKSGMIFVRYASRFGPLGNLLFGAARVKSLLGSQVASVGWFRRGIAPWMDLVQLQSEGGTIVNSYHRFWHFVLGGGAIALGLLLLVI
jgi:Zn-dependent protease with chaperone function